MYTNTFMQIPLIGRIRMKHAVVFATGLFLLQQIEHTAIAFSGLTFLYILLSTLAFNAVGGFVYPSGWFVFFNALLVAIFGLVYKALLGEAAESHLRAPTLTMLAYCLGMAVTLFVGILARKLVPRRGLLVGMGFGEDMKKAAQGAFIVGAVIQFFSYGSTESGSLLSALKQINYFTQMGVLLGTFYQVKKTNGAQSSNWIVWASGIFMFVTGGLVGFSKYGLLVSAATWLAACVAAGHNFGRKQILLIVSFFIVFDMYLVPYSQIGRNLRAEDPTVSDDIKVAANLLPHLQELRTQYLLQQRDEGEDESRPHLYDSGQGFFDRLNMLAPDDLLISYTAEGNEEGLLPTYLSFLNVVPHFIWKDKPFYYIGNLYAREIGMISEDNEGTGVSFSPTGDAFHQAGFFGVALILPPILFVLFIVMDSLSGDIRESPWGILFCVLCTHFAPEGMIGGQIYIATYVAFGVVVVALLSKYVLPILSGVIANTDRTRVRKTVDFKPVLRPRSQPIKVGPAPENP
jgi:hypothetical protein